MKTIKLKYDEAGKLLSCEDSCMYFEQENESLQICADISTDYSVRAYIRASNNNSTVIDDVELTEDGYILTVGGYYMSKGTLYVGFESYDEKGYIERYEPANIYIESFVNLGSGTSDNVYVVTARINDVVTLDSDENAYIENIGTSKDLVLNVGIPQGIQGIKGDKGDIGPTGPQGEKGDPFTYEDFTTEQLAKLKGEKGDTGDVGPKGSKGDKGDRGIQGIQGIQGQRGATGEKGETGAKGEPGYTPQRGIDYLTDADIEENNSRYLPKATSSCPIAQTKLTAKSNAENYCIYGNTQDVGDLVTEGENEGKYKIETKATGKNVCKVYGFSTYVIKSADGEMSLSNNAGTAISTTDPADSIVITQTQYPNTSEVTHYNNGYFMIGVENLNLLVDGGYTVFSFDYEITSNPLGTLSGMVLTNSDKVTNFTLPDADKGRVSVVLKSGNYKERNCIAFRMAGRSMILSNFQLENGSSTDYEPYRENTVTVYTDEPLRMCGEVADYIDYKVQKVYRKVGYTETDGNYVLDTPVEETTSLQPLYLEEGLNNVFLTTSIQPNNIKVEYYQNPTLVIEELRNAILSQGGNV